MAVGAPAAPAETQRFQAEQGLAASVLEGEGKKLSPLSQKLDRDLREKQKSDSAEAVLVLGAKPNEGNPVNKNDLNDRMNDVPKDIAPHERANAAWKNELIASYDKQGGIDGLSMVDQNEIFTAMYDTLSRDPNFRARFAGQDITALDSGVRAAITEFMGNDEFKLLFRQAVEGRAGKPILNPEKVAQMEKAVKEAEVARELYNKKAAEARAVQEQFDQNSAKEKAFNTPPSKGQSNAQELQDLSANAGALSIEIAGLQANKESYQRSAEQKIAMLNSQVRNLDTRTISAEIDQLQRLERDVSEKLAQANVKVARQQELEKDLAEINAAKVNLPLAHASILADIDTLAANWREVNTKAGTQEAVLMTDVQRDTDSAYAETFGEAAKNLYDNRIARNIDTANKLLREYAAQETDQARAILLKTRGERWQIDKGTKRDNLLRKRPVIQNQDLPMRDDSNVLFTQGPEAFMRRLLIEQGMDETAVDARLKDKDFVASIQNEIIHQLISSRDTSSRRLTEAEQNTLATSEWGKAYLNRGMSVKSEEGQVAKNIVTREARRMGIEIKDENYAAAIEKIVADGKNPNFLMLILLVLAEVAMISAKTAGAVVGVKS